MIDHLDKQTQPLPLDQKRSRGRPATGQALSNAERQRRYREAQKAQRNENMHKEVAEDLRGELAKALERIEELESEIQHWKKLATAAERARQVVVAELMQRDEKPADQDEPETCWRIQKRKSSKGRWTTMKGSYRSESEAHEALLEMPQEHPVGTAWYRVLEIKNPAAGEL